MTITEPDLDAEQRVLASFLREDVYRPGANFFDTDDFGVLDHATIFGAIRESIVLTEGTNAVQVPDYLTDYLAELRQLPIPGDCWADARAVKANARRRATEDGLYGPRRLGDVIQDLLREQFGHGDQATTAG